MGMGKRLSQLWALPGLAAAGRVLGAALVLGTDHLASFLGHPWVLAHYHLWLAALVVFGPLLQFHVSPRLIFANKNNFFHVRFVDSAWGWTLLLSAGFVLPLSVRSGPGPALRSLLRLGLASGLQLACLRAFGLVRDASGSCFSPAEAGLLLVPEARDQAECLAQAGRLWQGYSVSAPCFLLTYGSLVLAEELAPFRSHLRAARPAPASLRLLFLLAAGLLGLWSGLLLLSAVFFHRYSQKLVGAGCAQLCWRLTYRLWYPRGWGPGLPGDWGPGTPDDRGPSLPGDWGPRDRAPESQRFPGPWGRGAPGPARGDGFPGPWGPGPGHRPSRQRCVCGAAERGWDPATETLWYRE